MTKPRKKARPRPVTLREAEGSDDSSDTPLAEGRNDELGADQRHRLISERAYARYCERGYADGYDMDDWLEAEVEVDYLALHRDEGGE